MLRSSEIKPASFLVGERASGRWQGGERLKGEGDGHF